jgi:hypothetical protein
MLFNEIRFSFPHAGFTKDCSMSDDLIEKKPIESCFAPEATRLDVQAEAKFWKLLIVDDED